MVDSDEWGEGGGVGTDGRVGSAAGPSSSMCALVVRVRARRLCARSSSACVLVVLSVGIRYVWVARRRCLREARRREWVGVVGCGLGRCSWALGCRL